MTEQKNIEAEKPEAAESNGEPVQAKPAAAPETSWLRRNRDNVIGVGLILAVLGGFAFFTDGFASPLEEAMKANNIESAYTDVVRQNVAVNGYRGDPEWRGYYKLGLERFLGQHDFSDLCTPNGFLKDSYVAGAQPCIAIGDKRALRSWDNTVSYFKEDSWRRMAHPLDVMQQDVHADDYLDIDAFSKAVEDRATKQVADAAAAAKAAAEEEARKTKESEERIRAFQEALKSRYPIQIPSTHYDDPSDTSTNPVQVVPGDTE